MAERPQAKNNHLDYSLSVSGGSTAGRKKQKKGGLGGGSTTQAAEIGPAKPMPKQARANHNSKAVEELSKSTKQSRWQLQGQSNRPIDAAT